MRPKWYPPAGPTYGNTKLLRTALPYQRPRRILLGHVGQFGRHRGHFQSGRRRCRPRDGPQGSNINDRSHTGGHGRHAQILRGPGRRPRPRPRVRGARRGARGNRRAPCPGRCIRHANRASVVRGPWQTGPRDTVGGKARRHGRHAQVPLRRGRNRPDRSGEFPLRAGRNPEYRVPRRRQRGHGQLRRPWVHGARCGALCRRCRRRRGGGRLRVRAGRGPASPLGRARQAAPARWTAPA